MNTFVSWYFFYHCIYLCFLCFSAGVWLGQVLMRKEILHKIEEKLKEIKKDNK